MSVCPSVRLSHAGILSKRHTFLPSGRHTILVFPYQTVWKYSDGIPPNGGVECRRIKNRDFRPISRFISEIIQNSYSGRLPVNRMWSIEWRHFQWSWTILNLDFKVTPLFDAECLRNCTRYIRSYNRILIGAYTRRTQGRHFKWPWVTLSDLVKYSITGSTRDLCATAELLVF